MKKKDFLKQLIEDSYAYFDSSATEDYSLAEFATYLSIKTNPIETSDHTEPASKPKKLSSEADDLGINLVLLYRYAKEYVKHALKGSPLSTPDEFSFLITLVTGKTHTKAELIEKMVLNRTSGIEVIKRLLRKGFITEFDDEHDKRSKRVAITEKGRNVVFSLLPHISKSSEAIAGNLTDKELRIVNQILGKLELYHREKSSLV